MADELPIIDKVKKPRYVPKRIRMSKECRAAVAEVPNTRQGIAELQLRGITRHMDSKGITIEKLVDKLKEELDATEVKVFNDKGEVIYSNELVAWEVRQKARQDAHKLRGDYILDNAQKRPPLLIQMNFGGDTEVEVRGGGQGAPEGEVNG